MRAVTAAPGEKIYSIKFLKGGAFIELWQGPRAFCRFGRGWRGAFFSFPSSPRLEAHASRGAGRGTPAASTTRRRRGLAADGASTPAPPPPRGGGPGRGRGAEWTRRLRARGVGSGRAGGAREGRALKDLAARPPGRRESERDRAPRGRLGAPRRGRGRRRWGPRPGPGPHGSQRGRGPGGPPPRGCGTP